MTSLSVSSWNVGDAGLGRDLIAVAAGSDAVCLQEAADRDAMLAAFTVKNPAWILFRVDVPGGAHSPVLVDTAALGAPVNVTAHHAVDATRICPEGQKPKGAGPPVIKPKVITDVELANGVHLLNTHMIPSVTMSKAKLKNKPSPGDPRGEFEWKARRQHFRDHMDAIVAVVRAIDGPVILTADFNCEPDFELMQPLHDPGFVGWTLKPTHDTRAIDHVAFLPDRGLTRTGTAVLGTASDHKAVVATYELEPLVPDPYARSTYHGKPLDNATIDAIKAAEGILGYELTIVQGIGGASASAGTHLEGRVVDLVDWDTDNKLRVLKDLGFAIWRRPTIPGLWNSHIHGCLILDTRSNPRGIAAAALRQIESFDRGRDGLAGDGPDNTYRPDPKVTFHYPYEEPPVPPTVTKVSKARDQIVEAINASGLGSALLDDADDVRAPIRKFTERLNAVEAELRAILKDMPKT